ncbi:MAG: glutamate-1-semialdehyde 2,1-aminomutase [bacterium]
MKIGEAQRIKDLYQKALQYIPGGINSPARAFRPVKEKPIFVEKGSGAYIFDKEGKKYIDHCLSFGAIILGHSHPGVSSAIKEAIDKGTNFGLSTEKEVILSEIICKAIPSIEKIRLVNSGTEAVMSAVRLSRGWTKRKRIIKFEGGYHGCVDSLLVSCGSSLTTLGVPTSSGIPEEFFQTTIVLPYNDIPSFKAIIEKYHPEIAAVIVEPIAGNMGIIPANLDFLRVLREETEKYKILLIFDEIITGFRLCFGGFQNIIGIKPDITLLGKIIGGGLPIGAYGGKKEIMDCLAPDGDVFSAGTFSGNPIVASCGISVLNILKEENPYNLLEKKTKYLLEGLSGCIKVNQVGSMFTIFFTDGSVFDYKSAKTSDCERFANFFKGLLNKGIYFPPSQFETGFLSTCHTDKDIEKTKKAINFSLQI